MTSNNFFSFIKNGEAKVNTNRANLLCSLLKGKLTLLKNMTISTLYSIITRMALHFDIRHKKLLFKLKKKKVVLCLQQCDSFSE